MERIPVSSPWLGDLEASCVQDALAKSAISGNYGEYLPLFESEFARYCGCPFGVAVSSGTTALQLALLALGVKPGDEVLVSTLTNMATWFAILHVGAIPVAVDIEADTLNMDPALLPALATRRTTAILVVHLFGHSVDMDPVLRFAKERGLRVIEDCAEAHGADYKGRKVGGLGDAGCFSFYANKIITTGEGGMVTFREERHAERARSLKALAFGRSNKFMHEDIGYNFRMTNLQAALGHAQFSKIEEVIARKRKIAALYNARFASVDGLRLPVEKPYARNVYWMYHVVLADRLRGRREEIMMRLEEAGIETRQTFVPGNLQEVFIQRGWTSADACPRANEVADAGFYLPSGATLTIEQLERVAAELMRVLASPPRNSPHMR